ncbi:ADM_collapsed_G0016570.mRNA.1.CDS.1 [Saccharomyces cerevisiae]|nr:ADM_collapsed_G0016570.mRNA.1.CDS.1 [Saccharomyces cerevisiae]
MLKSAVYSILAASLVNAGTIPLGKLSDIDKIGTQTRNFPIFGWFWAILLFPGDYGISRDLPESCEIGSKCKWLVDTVKRYPTVSKAKSI